MDIGEVGATIVFVSAFLALDGYLRKRLYRGEPNNSNFRVGFAINRFRGRWELRLVALLVPVGLSLMLVHAVTGA